MILNSLMHPFFFLLIFLCTSITFLLVCLSWDKVLQGYSSNLVTYGMLFLGCWTCLFKFHRFTCIFPAPQMCWELSSRAVCDTTMGHRFKFTFKPGFSQAFLVTAVAVLSTAMTLNFHVFLVFLHVSHCFLSNLLQAGLIKMGAKFAPCMRLDDNLRRVLEEERRIENETGCCVKSDDSGCIQTSRKACSVSFYTCQTFGGLFILNFSNLLHFNFFHTCMSPCIWFSWSEKSRKELLLLIDFSTPSVKLISSSWNVSQ